MSRRYRRSIVFTLLLAAACGGSNTSNGDSDSDDGACPANTKACGNGCIPALGTVCCEGGDTAASSSYCTNSAGGGCFANEGRCSAAFPAGVQADHCCSENGSVGSNDCPAGQHHCGLLCYTDDKPCASMVTGTPAARDSGECMEAQGACEIASDCCVGDCCEGRCLDTGSGAEACGSTGGASGEVTVTDASCVYQGVFGIDLSEFQVTLSGTATVPPGGAIIVYSDPSTTMGASAGPEGPHSCGSWTAPSGPGDCNRGPGEPETTSFTLSYNFSSTSRSGEISPSVSAIDASGNSLDNVAPTVQCGGASGTPDGGTAGTGGGTCSSTSTPPGSSTCGAGLTCPTHSCALSCDGSTCTCLSNGSVQRSFPQGATCDMPQDFAAAMSMCSCFP